MALSKTLFVTLLFLGTLSVDAQNMYDMQKAYQNKWRATFGVGGVEPIAFHAQFYKGFSCKGLRGWILEAQVGVEGMVYKTAGKPYMGGIWDKGAIRYSFSYNRRLFMGLSDYIKSVGILGGFGIQAGNRNYMDLDQNEKTRYAVGPMLNVNLEVYAMDKRISKDQYLGIIIFVEYIYHREFQKEFFVSSNVFFISRFNGGIRLNFYS